jgi:hypothetical protein
MGGGADQQAAIPPHNGLTVRTGKGAHEYNLSRIRRELGIAGELGGNAEQHR